jgi:outer membrane receptor protein involved in Fe transport
MRIEATGAALLALALTGVSSPARAADPGSEVSPLVVSATPLAGAALDIAAAASPIQTASAQQIEASHALDLTAFMNRTLGGVYINDVQNNPLQPDVNYRGYTASPLLGTPQGLSVYLDGVRLNQPFGDVVSWDLIPKAAIASLALVPGSNPLFGLNTLGGALSIRTKDGLSASGTTAQFGYGSHNRWQAEVETGGHADNGLNWYFTANRFRDDGWREASPSAAAQAFGKLGWSDGRTDLALSGAYAYTDLTGNGLQDQRLLGADYASVYTVPDITRNQSAFLNLTATHKLSEDLTFSGGAYYRRIDSKTLNGDINDNALGENLLQPNATERAALTAAGYSGFPTSGETADNTPFPKWRCIADALLNTEPNEKCDGLLGRTATDQSEGGASGQFTLAAPLGDRPNQLTVGAAFAASRAHFVQSAQFGYLNPDRSITPVAGPGAFADGSQDSESAFDSRVDLTGRTHSWSLYATDTFTLTPAVKLTISGRYDATRVQNRDALTPSGPGSLTGDNRFARFNPAVGLTYSPTKSLTAYAGYSQGSRAPSAIELGCADPDNPCRLPNALAGDPPLKQVIARTVEAGLRGKAFSGRASWSAGLFRAENHDDIMFVADSVSGFGYFRNFGLTRRQGIELAFDSRWGPVSFGAHYTWLDATYRSQEVVPGAGNSSNNAGPGFEGAITVQPGDRIPLIPRQIFKAEADWAVSGRLTLDADMIAVGGSYARGNENNQHQPDGVFYLGPGETAGYAVFNLGADYRPTPPLKLFVQVSNLFDARYDTAAQFGSTGFTTTGAFIARPFAGPAGGGELPQRGVTFFAPGAPRMVWAGVRYAFGG